MNTNPEREFTFMDWLETDQSNDFTEFFNPLSGIPEEGFIDLKVPGIIKREEVNKIIIAKNHAFEFFIEQLFEGLIANFLKGYERATQKKAFKELEKKATNEQLNADYQNYRSALINQRDLNVISGLEYKISKDNWTIENERRIFQLKHFYVFKIPTILAFARLKFLEWLEKFKQEDFLTLENLFVGTPKDYNMIMEELTQKKISSEKNTEILSKKGNHYKWNHGGYGGKSFLTAFLFTLIERGWLDLADEDNIPFSNENLAKIITNTFGLKISKETAAVLKVGRPNDIYLEPFKDIPFRNLTH
jgi:hypothetical protein